MKVRVLETHSVVDPGFGTRLFLAGKEYNLPQALATVLFESGCAEFVSPAPEPFGTEEAKETETEAETEAGDICQ